MNYSAQTTPERIKELKEFLKKSKSVREKERLLALVRLAEGRKRKEVAGFLGIHIKTLDRWSSTFKKQGMKGILEKPQPGNHRLLTKKEREKTKEIINSTTPKEMGLESNFWTVPALRQLTAQKFKVFYKSETSLRNLFAYCGFTFHKPTKINRRRKDGMRKRFETVLKKRSDGTVEKMGWYW